MANIDPIALSTRFSLETIPDEAEEDTLVWTRGDEPDFIHDAPSQIAEIDLAWGELEDTQVE